MGRYPVPQKQTLERARKMFESGATLAEIAKRCQRTKSWAYNLTYKHGWKRLIDGQLPPVEMITRRCPDCRASFQAPASKRDAPHPDCQAVA